MDIRVGGKFKVSKKLGQGAFGDLYAGHNIKTNEEVAIKIEALNCERPLLNYESQIIQQFQGINGFPQSFWFGVEGDYTVLVMNIMGPNLQQLFHYCDQNFGLKTVLLIGIQVLDRLAVFHSKKFVHRDMKPENILIGSGKKVNTINLIDFGLSKRYISPCTGKHIPITQKPGCVGTFRFLSYNAHQGYEHSRRDDLESLGNILIHFMLKGKLPWAAFQHPDDELQAQGKVPETNKVEYQVKLRKYENRVKACKMNSTLEHLCQGLPKEFLEYMTYCRRLGFEENPDYAYLKALFEGLMKDLGYEDDGVYEWTLAKIRIEQQNQRDLEEQERMKKLKETKSALGKNVNAKMILELERLNVLRKIQEEESKKLLEEEEWAKQQAEQDRLNRDDDKQRMIAKQLIEEKRMEMRKRIQERIKVVMQQEEDLVLKPKKRDGSLVVDESPIPVKPAKTKIKKMRSSSNLITVGLLKEEN